MTQSVTYRRTPAPLVVSFQGMSVPRIGTGHVLRGRGLQNGRGGGGMCSFTPTKRGGKISFSHAEGGGGHNKFWGRFYAVA